MVTGSSLDHLLAKVGEVLSGATGRNELVIYVSEGRVDTLTRNPSFLGDFGITQYKTSGTDLQIDFRYSIRKDNPFFETADKIMKEAKL